MSYLDPITKPPACGGCGGELTGTTGWFCQAAPGKDAAAMCGPCFLDVSYDTWPGEPLPWLNHQGDGKWLWTLPDDYIYPPGHCRWQVTEYGYRLVTTGGQTLGYVKEYASNGRRLLQPLNGDGKTLPGSEPMDLIYAKTFVEVCAGLTGPGLSV